MVLVALQTAVVRVVGIVTLDVEVQTSSALMVCGCSTLFSFTMLYINRGVQ